MLISPHAVKKVASQRTVTLSKVMSLAINQVQKQRSEPLFETETFK
jgi:hypothetical protein